VLYKVINKTSGNEVDRYIAAAIVESFDGKSYPLAEYDHIDITLGEQIPQTVFGGRREISKNEFIQLIGDTAYKTLLTLAKTSIDIEAWVKRLDLAQQDANGYSVYLDDPLTIAGINQLEPVLIEQGTVLSGWAQEVLNG